MEYTNPPENYNITVEFSNTQLANISDLGGAVAFAHEVIHAEIYRKMLSAAQKGDLDPANMSPQEQVNYINNLRNDFPGLYDYYYDRYKPTWNHNMMAQHYRSAIAVDTPKIRAVSLIIAFTEYDTKKIHPEA